MAKFTRAIGRLLWTAGFALALTALASGIWSGLLVANLAQTPAIPGAAVAMAVVTWAGLAFFGGKGGPAGTRIARRNLLRARPLSFPLFAATVCAGVLCLVALAGFWLVLGQVVRVPANRVPDFSHYPLLTVGATLVMAAISGAVSEEAGFRGYFQGTLETHLPGPVAIFICALVMAPVHALTQGFVWPTLLFYLAVDAILGVSAWLTKSILPGIVTHAIGLFAFFAFIWPHDSERMLIWQNGPDPWFRIHVAQTLVFAALGIWAFARIARRVPAHPSSNVHDTEE